MAVAVEAISIRASADRPLGRMRRRCRPTGRTASTSSVAAPKDATPGLERTRAGCHGAARTGLDPRMDIAPPEPSNPPAASTADDTSKLGRFITRYHTFL